MTRATSVFRLADHRVFRTAARHRPPAASRRYLRVSFGLSGECWRRQIASSAGRVRRDPHWPDPLRRSSSQATHTHPSKNWQPLPHWSGAPHSPAPPRALSSGQRTRPSKHSQSRPHYTGPEHPTGGTPRSLPFRRQTRPSENWEPLPHCVSPAWCFARRVPKPLRAPANMALPWRVLSNGLYCWYNFISARMGRGSLAGRRVPPASSHYANSSRFAVAECDSFGCMTAPVAPWRDLPGAIVAQVVRPVGDDPRLAEPDSGHGSGACAAGGPGGRYAGIAPRALRLAPTTCAGAAQSGSSGGGRPQLKCSRSALSPIS